MLLLCEKAGYSLSVAHKTIGTEESERKGLIVMRKESVHDFSWTLSLYLKRLFYSPTIIFALSSINFAAVSNVILSLIYSDIVSSI